MGPRPPDPSHAGVGSVRVATAERLANGRHELEVAALFTRLDATRPRQVDLDDVRDATRVGRS